MQTEVSSCHLHLTGELSQYQPLPLSNVSSDQTTLPLNCVTVLTLAIANKIINKTAIAIFSAETISLPRRHTAAVFLMLHSTASADQFGIGVCDL